MQQLWVQSLGREDPLEKEMANHSSILAWEIPWTEEPEGLQSMGHKQSDMTEHTDTQTHTHLWCVCVHSPCGPNISPLGLSQLKVGCQAPARV